MVTSVLRAEVRRSFITTTVREESQVTPQKGATGRVRLSTGTVGERAAEAS